MTGRDYPSRPFCGVGVVCFKGDNILLIKRSKPPINWEWSIPGGGQELGETIREGALRELKEETAVEARIIGLIDVVDTIRRDKVGRIQFHYTLCDFAAEWISGDIKAGDDASDARWVGLSEIEDFDLWEETVRVIRQGQILRERTGH